MATLLLEEGFVSTIGGALRDNENSTEFLIAEESAKKSKKHVKLSIFFLRLSKVKKIESFGNIMILLLKKKKDKKERKHISRLKNLKLN